MYSSISATEKIIEICCFRRIFQLFSIIPKKLASSVWQKYLYKNITRVNEYDFHLLAVLVVDEYGSNILAALLISNKKDSNTFAIFCEKQSSSGHILITEDYASFYDAQKNITGDVTHLFCVWHVNK